MANVRDGFAKGKPIFVGIDVHKRDWTVHMVCQGEELYHSTIAPEPERLIATLRRFDASEVHVVYEAGPTGYWLHDALLEAGFDSMVTPPSLVRATSVPAKFATKPYSGPLKCMLGKKSPKGIAE